MVRFPKSKAATGVEQTLAHQDSSADDIQSRIAELRRLPREKLADAVFMLSMEAKRQTQQVWHAIRARAEVEYDGNPPRNADLAVYLADEAVSTLRHHVADAPTMLGLLVHRARDVRFTVRREEAIALLAATVREQRLEGILEGLRLAGLLTEPEGPPRRHRWRSGESRRRILNASASLGRLCPLDGARRLKVVVRIAAMAHHAFISPRDCIPGVRMEKAPPRGLDDMADFLSDVCRRFQPGRGQVSDRRP